MRLIFSVLACSMLMACGLPERPAVTGGKETRTGSSPTPNKETKESKETEDDDGPVPSDPATLARAAKMKVAESDDIGCTTEALGPVDVHKKMESTAEALENLKRRAAALGADGLTHVEFEHGEGGKEVTHLSGMAVRCNDLIKGRAYETIGEVQVDGSMGGEERAFTKLREKARSMHADMLINVRFEHGEGGDGEGTKMMATAIKFRSGS